MLRQARGVGRQNGERCIGNASWRSADQLDFNVLGHPHRDVLFAVQNTPNINVIWTLNVENKGVDSASVTKSADRAGLTRLHNAVHRWQDGD